MGRGLCLNRAGLVSIQGGGLSRWGGACVYTRRGFCIYGAGLMSAGMISGELPQVKSLNPKKGQRSSGPHTFHETFRKIADFPQWKIL